MARRVFFSFHYQNDIWRVSQIRNSWITKDREVAGFWDSASWEAVKRQGDAAIKRWINTQLEGTSVTVVLIGSETVDRKYVNYEIQRSYEMKKGLMGVYIHNMKNQAGLTCARGQNPLDHHYIEEQSPFYSSMKTKKYLSSMYKTYDWVTDNGYYNFASWVEEAARAMGR